MGVLDMLNPNLVLRLRLVLYAVLIFFSFFIFIGAAVMKDQRYTNCPLYCDRFWGCGSVSNCNYPIAISVIFQFIYLLARVALLLLLLLGKLGSDMFFFSDIVELLYVVIDLLAFFLTFIGACILSAGTNYTCGEFSCDGHSFYSASQAAQAGAWISTFVWLFVGVIGFLFLMRAGKIPCLPGAAAPQSSAGPANTAGPQDAPPAYPDETPKY